MNKKDKLYHDLESTLGYKFNNLELLKESITHKSFSNEHFTQKFNHNERLEFLGDAVLELVITDLIMARFPSYSEGDLSRLRASIVNESQLAELAFKLELGNVVLLGKGEEMTRGRKKNSILANTYEAILAALYLDGGYKTTYRIIKKHFSKLIDSAKQNDFDRDYKTKLQEEVQKCFKKIPDYVVTRETGPDHHKTFEVKVMVHADLSAFGSGKSKKEAEQDAARNALELLKEENKF